MNDLVDQFLARVPQTFAFLVTQYQYQHQAIVMHDLEVIRDASIAVRYVGIQVGVEICWYFAESAITVAFVELQQPHVFPDKRTFYPEGTRPGTANAIDMYTLADFLGHQDDPSFLLKNILNNHGRNISSRYKMIQGNLFPVLEGLARVTAVYGNTVLAGNTNIFPTVMAHYTRRLRELYPDDGM